MSFSKKLYPEEALSAWGDVSSELQTIAVTKSIAPHKNDSKCIAVPIVTSSSYIMKGYGYNPDEERKPEDYTYSRFGNPTRDHLEMFISELEASKHSISFGSGMAALSSVFLSLQQGDHIVSTKTIYGGTSAFLKGLARFGISVDFVADTKTSEITKLFNKNTKMIFMESPSNPTLRLVDIAEISAAAHKFNEEMIVVIDNTFLTPIYQRPLELGVDACVYSLSKYMGGHSDIIMGAVTTNSDALHAKIRQNQIQLGGIPSPYDCYLAIRSLKTLPIRLQQHFKNAWKVAQFLETHPNVVQVIFPGLPSHPQNELVLKQQLGGSGLVGFYIKGGLKEAAAFLENVKIILKAPSLGGDGSLVTIPAKMSHIQLTQEERNSLGITDNYIRLSVGLEGADSLIRDLDQALSKSSQNGVQ